MKEGDSRCRECGDGYAPDYITDGVCRFCAKKKLFASFARSCGLTRFPDPEGERYIYQVDGGFAGKKSECQDFMDELWNALVRAAGKDKSLLIGEESAT